MRSFLHVAAVLALLSALNPVAANATTMRYADIPTLTMHSDVVVRGQIVDQQVFLDPASGRISTRWTVSVESALKGGRTGLVSFVQWGGTLDGMVDYIPGDARFELREHVIVFLRTGDTGELNLTAMGQSRIEVLDPNLPSTGLPVTEAVMGPLQMVTGPVGVRDLRDISFYQQVDDAADITHIDFEMLSIESIESIILEAAEVDR
jgi:hypothetical protein